MAWLNLVGLAFDLAGAVVLAWGLFITQDEAIELGVSRYAGDTTQERLELPAVADRLRQSRNAKTGTALLVVGFALQIVSNPSPSSRGNTCSMQPGI
jgi:hypothetical protein